jgi:CheY-like chemotaxis protein
MPTPLGTILVVDDSKTMRNMIKKILEPVSYAVLEAKNGIEALAMALSDAPPEVIISPRPFSCRCQNASSVSIWSLG